MVHTYPYVQDKDDVRISIIISVMTRPLRRCIYIAFALSCRYFSSDVTTQQTSGRTTDNRKSGGGVGGTSDTII